MADRAGKAGSQKIIGEAAQKGGRVELKGETTIACPRM